MCRSFLKSKLFYSQDLKLDLASNSSYPIVHFLLALSGLNKIVVYNRNDASLNEKINLVISI